ncbi:hypothetical protein F5883DRAFT_531333 [Diaporthe sp. PMI_573]|nr:hypothetical protein F5883DRAFT_531333 [Diaporthaceae sp. PMI_573]
MVTVREGGLQHGIGHGTVPSRTDPRHPRYHRLSFLFWGVAWMSSGCQDVPHARWRWSNQTSKHPIVTSEQAKQNTQAGRIGDAGLQDGLRMQSRQAREWPGYPRHALCLARARYCTTPHRNFDGLASFPVCQSAHSGRLEGRRAGHAWVGRRLVVPGWFLGSISPCKPSLAHSPCLVLVQAPGSGSFSPAGTVMDGCISPPS